jgi:dynein heavy chain
MTGNSREKFDVFLRQLASGTNQEFPCPKSVKFSKSTLFPERGTVFDYFLQKAGTWASWEDRIDRSSTIPPDAKVRIDVPLLCESCCW